jgi:hypothetical protein
MSYSPPAGWVEPRTVIDRDGTGTGDFEVEFGLFHRLEDCPKVQQPARLRPIDRPYSATRCRRCAPETG